MRSHAGVAAKMFETLASEGINIEMISTSEIKISVLIELVEGRAGAPRCPSGLHRLVMARLSSVALAGAATAVAVALVLPLRIGAQSPAGALLYSTTLTPDMLAARLQAVREHMPYVPGEALVRFKDGFELTEQVRGFAPPQQRCAGRHALDWRHPSRPCCR